MRERGGMPGIAVCQPRPAAARQSHRESHDVLLARVVGTLVATRKHARFEATKLLLVQPTDPDGSPRGPSLLAVDTVGAGVGERVLVVVEGKAAGMALGKGPESPVDAAIVGIIDRIDVEGGEP